MLLLMLSISITAPLCAQQDPSARAFEIPADVIMNRSFTIDLGKGNKMQLELTDISDLENAANIDSLVQQCWHDLGALKDSLNDPLAVRRVDYVTDEKGRKKIRLRQYPPAASAFLVQQQELALLRTGQDTLHIITAIEKPLPAKDRVSDLARRYYRYTFILNDLHDLENYYGSLNEKIREVKNTYTGKWKRVPFYGNYLLQADKSISAPRPRGFNSGQAFDYLTLLGSVNVQNYKNYFVPSFSVGARLTLVNKKRSFKWEPGLFWEPHFLFAKDAGGNLKTYRNDFLTLTYAQGGVTDHDPMKDFSFSASFSLGYLLHREGTFFDKNSFRLGAGKVNVHKTSIEPSLYFNNFFKGVSPGIRITQYF